MNSLKKMSLMSLVLLGLAGYACGDDDDDDTGDGTDGQADAGGGDGTTDAGGDGSDDAGGGDGGGDLSASCKSGGTYDGFTGTQIKAGVADKGACITDKDIAEICKVNPSDQAGTAGSICYLGGQTGDALRECTIEGDDESDLQGIRDVAPNLSDACLNCYADSVACAAENCAAQCAGMAESQGCLDCRTQAKCQETFYTCSGLPESL